MPRDKKSICVISFSRIDRDARVLRQIKFLSRDYEVAVIGYGDAPPTAHDGAPVRWLPVADAPAAPGGLASKLKKRSLLIGGRLRPSGYDAWYWKHPQFRDALDKAAASGCDAFHANDWNALPVAAEAARRLGARLVFDAHEYAPLEFENQLAWRLAYAPAIRHFIRKYAPAMDASVTVAPAIAERYRREFGMDTSVVLNAPEEAAMARPVDRLESAAGGVRLIHHGAAIRDRRLEVMIEAVAQADARFSLHFMLTGADAAYAGRLRETARRLAPGRVAFHDPVTPDEIVPRVSQFDVGFCYIAPTNYNYLVSLPNKFFDFVAAGLPVVVGPSPSMAEIVRLYGLGCVARSFGPEDMAAALNALGRPELEAMREGARRAARELNAEREMTKLVGIYRSLLRDGR